MKNIYLLIALLAAEGCTALTYTSKTDTFADRLSKQEKYSITCLTWNSCYTKAEKICDNGYNILKKSKNLNAIPSLTHEIEVACFDPAAKKNNNENSNVKSDTLLFNKAEDKK
jgi:hypothetical protein